jgi:hypothetical protein
MNYKAILTLTIAVISFTATSQNKDKELAQNGPFASIGKKSKVLTLPGHDYVYSAPDTVEYFGWGFSRSKQDFVYVKSEQEMAKDTVRKKLKNESRSRWLSIDPVVHPFESPYAGMSNNPILFLDPDGGDIKPANDLAKTQIGEVFKAFDTKINDRSISGADLFGLQGRGVGFDKAPNQLVFYSSLSKSEFNKKLNKSSLNSDQKKEAKAIFKILSSNDIYEVATVNPSSKLNSGNTGQSQTNKFVTENSSANQLLTKATNGEITNPQIQAGLKTQVNSGTTDNGGTFGVFPDYQKAQSSDQYLKGVILINTPATTESVKAPSDNSTNRAGEPSTETKTIIKSLDKASEKIPN